MHEILMVIRREYRDRVRKKSFWIGTLVFPAIMALMVLAPMALMFLSPDEEKRIALVDPSGKLASPLAEALADEKLRSGSLEYRVEPVPLTGTPEEHRAALEPQVASGELFGVLMVGEDLDAENNFRLYGKNVGNPRVLGTLQGALRQAVIGLRLERSNLSIDRQALEALTKPVSLETFQVLREGGSSKKGFEEAYFGTFIFVMILYMSLVLYGIAVMRGILEEKSSRVMEVLLGSLTPQQLMTGKIIGIGLVGLTQIAVYVVVGIGLRAYVAAQATGQDWQGMLDAFSAGKLLWFVVFYLLGYFMYTALFAAVGAVCNSEQEAQNMQTPVIMCLVLPLVATIFFVGNPESTVAVVVSLIPLFTPMVMYMRISTITPPLWQILLGVVLTLGTTWLLFRGVGKIFRIGILMYGKRPTIPEILRWARG